jgi:peptidoglycan biosynthesis protein MviN/MurJ (putative lipid II flippase)
MKSTKIMLAVILTALCTWFALSLMVYTLSNMTFKESATSYGVILIMMIVGWIPSIIVGIDIEEKLKYK